MQFRFKYVQVAKTNKIGHDVGGAGKLVEICRIFCRCQENCTQQTGHDVLSVQKIMKNV
jgi:hypothetical protein